MNQNLLKYIILIILLSELSVWPLSPLPPQRPTKIESRKDCATCHIEWASSPDKELEKTSPLFKKGLKTAGTAEMCFSCHDGSIADSRYKVWCTKGHVTGKPVPEWVTIPTDQFPLDSKNRITCATCHTPHAIASTANTQGVIFLRQPNVDASLCYFCHKPYLNKWSVMHSMGEQKKKLPQSIAKAGGRIGSSGRFISCQTCHLAHGSNNDKRLALSLAKICITCHTDKSPLYADSLHQTMHRIGETFEGFVPPKSLVDKGAKFGPGGELTCLSCHEVHHGIDKRAHLIMDNRKSDLCLECHKEKENIVGSKHDMSLLEKPFLNKDGLSISEVGACGICHKSHGWALERRSGISANSPLCVECHLKGGIASREQPFKKGHPIDIAVNKKQAETSLPLRTNNKVSCITCHVMHGQTETESVLRMPQQELCLNCHEQKQAIFNGLHNTGEPWAKEIGFESTGQCKDCHPAHQPSGKFGIWQKLGEHVTGQTCLDCHHQKGPGKPVKARHLEQSIEQNGISVPIQCNQCHEIHQPKKDKNLIQATLRDSILCLECHPASRPLINSPHDLRITAPDFINNRGETVGVSGPCGACHLIHDTEEGKGPWAVTPKPGEHFVDGLCLGCHQTGAVGYKWIPRFTGHPIVSLINRYSKDSVGYMPTYDENGKPSAKGSVTCLSCHEPHVGPVTGEKDTTVETSLEKVRFLRPTTSQKLCKDCHGIEALWRLLYFHRRDKFPFSRHPSYSMPLEELETK